MFSTESYRYFIVFLCFSNAFSKPVYFSSLFCVFFLLFHPLPFLLVTKSSFNFRCDSRSERERKYPGKNFQRCIFFPYPDSNLFQSPSEEKRCDCLSNPDFPKKETVDCFFKRCGKSLLASSWETKVDENLLFFRNAECRNSKAE